MNRKTLRKAFAQSDFDQDGLLNTYELDQLGLVLFGCRGQGELYSDICQLLDVDPLIGLSLDDINVIFGDTASRLAASKRGESTKSTKKKKSSEKHNLGSIASKSATGSSSSVTSSSSSSGSDTSSKKRRRKSKKKKGKPIDKLVKQAALMNGSTTSASEVSFSAAGLSAGARGSGPLSDSFGGGGGGGSGASAVAESTDARVTAAPTGIGHSKGVSALPATFGGFDSSWDEDNLPDIWNDIPMLPGVDDVLEDSQARGVGVSAKKRHSISAKKHVKTDTAFMMSALMDDEKGISSAALLDGDSTESSGTAPDDPTRARDVVGGARKKRLDSEMTPIEVPPDWDADRRISEKDENASQQQSKRELYDWLDPLTEDKCIQVQTEELQKPMEMVEETKIITREPTIEEMKVIREQMKQELLDTFVDQWAAQIRSDLKSEVTSEVYREYQASLAKAVASAQSEAKRLAVLEVMKERQKEKEEAEKTAAKHTGDDAGPSLEETKKELQVRDEEIAMLKIDVSSREETIEQQKMELMQWADRFKEFEQQKSNRIERLSKAREIQNELQSVLKKEITKASNLLNEKKELEVEVSEMKKEIELLKESIEAQKLSDNQLTQNIRRKEEEIGNLSDFIEKLQIEKDKLKEEFEEQISELKSDLQKARKNSEAAMASSATSSQMSQSLLSEKIETIRELELKSTEMEFELSQKKDLIESLKSKHKSEMDNLTKNHLKDKAELQYSAKKEAHLMQQEIDKLGEKSVQYKDIAKEWKRKAQEHFDEANGLKEKMIEMEERMGQLQRDYQSLKVQSMKRARSMTGGSKGSSGIGSSSSDSGGIDYDSHPAVAGGSSAAVASSSSVSTGVGFGTATKMDESKSTARVSASSKSAIAALLSDVALDEQPGPQRASLAPDIGLKHLDSMITQADYRSSMINDPLRSVSPETEKSPAVGDGMTDREFFLMKMAQMKSGSAEI